MTPAEARQSLMREVQALLRQKMQHHQTLMVEALKLKCELDTIGHPKKAKPLTKKAKR